MGSDRLFSDEEAERILHRAAKGTTGGIPEARLIQMGDELGISREAVTAAATQVIEESQQKADRREFALYKRRALLSHLMTYLFTNAGLIGLNFAQAHQITWAWFVVAGWGIGVLSQVRETFAQGSHEYEKEFVKWRKKRREGKTVGYPLSSVGIHVHTGESASDGSRRVASLDELLPLVETEALRENLNKIEAIRRLRDQAGISLVDAKAAVEAFDRANPGILRA